MDPLRADDLRWARETPPGEKLRVALEMSDFGIRLQRENLRRRNPDVSEAEIDELLWRWLARDDR